MDYPVPNYTQTPNVFFDNIMKTLTESEFRVMLAIIRKTFGWHKTRDRISLSQIMEITGMSRQGVINGIDGLLRKGHINCYKYKSGNEYEVKVVNEVDQSSQEVVNEVDYPSQRSRLPDAIEVVNEVDTQKKPNLNKEIKDSPFVNFKHRAGQEGIDTSKDGWMTQYLLRL